MEKHLKPKNNSEDLRYAVTVARKQIMDLLEMAFGEHPKWPMARTCVLRALGESGLEGALDAVNGQNQIGGSHD